MDVALLTHNLHVLARIEHGDKLYTMGTRFDVRSRSMAQSTMRWLAGEGRDLNLECVKFTFGTAMAVLTLCDEGDPYSIIAERDSVCVTLERDVKQAAEGLERLKHTYRDDVGMEIQLAAVAEQAFMFLRRRAQIRHQGHLEASPTRSDLSMPSRPPSPLGLTAQS